MNPTPGVRMAKSLAPEPDDDDALELHKYLTFVVGDEVYGLPISFVREIVGLQPFTILPDVPRWVRGVINLRGKVIPILDVRDRLGLPSREYGPRTCIIVTLVKEWWVGWVVDQVSEVVVIPPHAIEEPPHVGRGGEHFIQGLGKLGDQVRLILDAERLMGSPKL
jgi:purine-binding chemotaxis protein CheW